MKKPIPKIRVFCQRSIDSSFLNHSSIPVEGSSDNTSKKKAANCVSFSNFLDSKLNIDERPRPFISLVSSKDLTQLSHGFGVEIKAREENKNGDGGLEKMMLQQFKPREIQISEEVSRDIPGEVSLELLEQTADEETDNMGSNSDEGIIVKDDKISKKRKDPFEGMESMSRTGKCVIVFGDNSKVSKPMQSDPHTTIMQMGQDGGTVTWKVLIRKKWGHSEVWKELSHQHSEILLIGTNKFMEPLTSKVPTMVIEGDHEIEPQASGITFKSYSERFAVPSSESGSNSNLYYSFDGGGVHFVMLGA